MICINAQNEPVLYGIVSGGYEECGLSRYPGIYTKVANVLDFVSDVVFGNKDADFDIYQNNKQLSEISADKGKSETKFIKEQQLSLIFE